MNDFLFALRKGLTNSHLLQDLDTWNILYVWSAIGAVIYLGSCIALQVNRNFVWYPTFDLASCGVSSERATAVTGADPIALVSTRPSVSPYRPLAHVKRVWSVDIFVVSVHLWTLDFHLLAGSRCSSFTHIFTCNNTFSASSGSSVGRAVDCRV